MRYNVLSVAIRPLIATIIMLLVTWPLRDLFILVPIVVGAVVYIIRIFGFGVVYPEDRIYLRQIFKQEVV